MHRKSAFSLGISNSNLACVIIGLQRSRKVKKKKKSNFRLRSTLITQMLEKLTSRYGISTPDKLKKPFFLRKFDELLIEIKQDFTLGQFDFNNKLPEKLKRNDISSLLGGI